MEEIASFKEKDIQGTIFLTQRSAMQAFLKTKKVSLANFYSELKADVDALKLKTTEFDRIITIVDEIGAEGIRYRCGLLSGSKFSLSKEFNSVTFPAGSYLVAYFLREEMMKNGALFLESWAKNNGYVLHKPFIYRDAKLGNAYTPTISILASKAKSP